MSMLQKTMAVAAVIAGLATAAPANSQSAPEWRTVAPENVLVIETAKGRVVAELDPRVAPLAVERIRTLADQGFYDGLKFHRVIPNFMAQTGDPLGTGEGGSELPDLAGEFEFRRGRSDPFLHVAPTSGGQTGVFGSLPVRSQPDAQMMITADFKAAATALFCPGVLGMARADSPDSANSQFFIMTGANPNLNGGYTAFGRVVAGLDVVRSLAAGTAADNGRVPEPDGMTRVRTAAALPEGERPTVRVQVPTSPAFAAEVERLRADQGARLDVCNVQPAAEVAG